MKKRTYKLAILGGKGFQRLSDDLRIDCFEWTNIDNITNIRDYDMILINLLVPKTPEKINEVDWDKFLRLLQFRSTMDILRNEGSIIIIGDPRFNIECTRPGNKKNEQIKSIPFLCWTGIDFMWDDSSGDTVEFNNNYEHRAYENYISRLSKWKYSLSSYRLNKEVLREYFNLDFIESKGSEICLKQDFFCVNRYKYALAFNLRFQYIAQTRSSREVLESYGPLIFLPETSLTPDDTIQLVLNDICGVETLRQEPDWIEKYIAPGQRQIDERIRAIEIEIRSAFDNLKLAKDERDDIRKCLKLLYEREKALEPIVRDILRNLGAHVEDPSEQNKEDGWVVVKVGEETYEGVLEVKSTRTDQFDEGGRKQLLDWIDRGRTLRNKKYKGIFIGNSAVDKPLNERPWAFSDSWSRAAELSEICALKTEDLYLVYILHSKGSLDLTSFWRSLFNTNGIMNMQPYREMLAIMGKKE